MGIAPPYRLSVKRCPNSGRYDGKGSDDAVEAAEDKRLDEVARFLSNEKSYTQRNQHFFRGNIAIRFCSSTLSHTRAFKKTRCELRKVGNVRAQKKARKTCPRWISTQCLPQRGLPGHQPSRRAQQSSRSRRPVSTPPEQRQDLAQEEGLFCLQDFHK